MIFYFGCGRILSVNQRKIKEMVHKATSINPTKSTIEPIKGEMIIEIPIPVTPEIIPIIMNHFNVACVATMALPSYSSVIRLKIASINTFINFPLMMFVIFVFLELNIEAML